MSHPRRPGPDTTPGQPLLHIRLHGWPDDEHTNESPGFVAQLAKTLAKQGLLPQVTLENAAANSSLHRTGSSQPAVSCLDFLPGLLSPSQADQLLRQALADRGMAYSVLYGSTAERLDQALELIRRQLTQQSKTAARPTEPAAATGSARWVWACEKCSDPSCEHRLLTDLLARRAAAGP